MSDTQSKALKVKEKKELTTASEQIQPGPAFTPAVDIFETDHDITVLADMPGVKAKNLNIDLRDDVLTLAGDVKSPEGPDEVEMLTEYQTGKYFRQFTLSEVIDQSNIDANLKDGVLRLNLPKIAPATPRKIKVKVA
ncbi:MAG TPA: heat-shock protein Hsp20 [Desulfobacteraceae bacterium]|nr:heat-shock protein Hsp20 [Desulfobacteraceae bacterium]